jgi:polygalacturonase
MSERLKLFLYGGVAALFLGSGFSVRGAEPQAYPLPSVYPVSDAYELQAEGVDVPVVKYGGYHYAHFSMGDGPCRLRIKSLNGTISQHSISPLKLKLKGSSSGSTLSFTLEQPTYVIVSTKGNPRLVIMADPPETDKPASSGNGIFNVAEAPYGADKTGEKLATEAIQKAIDDASARMDGGTVYVPAGLYHTSTLMLKSNVALYLEGGAFLRCTGKPGDYKKFFRKDSQGRDGTWLVYTEEGAENMKLYGRGTLDGNGVTMEHNHYGMQILLVVGCSKITVDGIMVRESAAWSVIVAQSNDVTMKNFKVINPTNMGENDAIDIVNSQNVTVQRAIGIAFDDSFSTKCLDKKADIVKNWPGDAEPIENVTFEDCLAWTGCFGFKMGQGAFQHHDKVTFKNCVVYDCAVGIGMHHKAGTDEMRNVVFDTIDIERISGQNVGKTWAMFFIQEKKDNKGSISNVAVRNITVRDKGTSGARVKGAGTNAVVKDVTFQNIFMPKKKSPATTLRQMDVSDTGNDKGTEVLSSTGESTVGEDEADPFEMEVPSTPSLWDETKEKEE